MRPCPLFPVRRRSLLRLLLVDISDRFQQAAMVKPVDPFEGGVFDSFKAPPWAATMNDFRFEQAVDCLGNALS
jgi:hypothetical protein